MHVKVKLYGPFQRFSPEGRSEFETNVPEGSSVGELLKTLYIPPEQARVLLVNGRRTEEPRELATGDIMVLF